jgi:hypothetical protein
MLKRKLTSIVLLLAVVMAALGLRFATVTTSTDARSAQVTPADPIPIPISPPPN